ncbi:hypothetical protein QAD02_015844 [Eretmocerus hayati]|uniref:Uncharacterized protein n=1 Tax=Eretmocerus hayati TaxID=131215 RepID=A0ACC2P9E0_9HYME|nr:hypothetical protein QAD02_015844 [Eretmocerus hayati]
MDVGRIWGRNSPKAVREIISRQSSMEMLSDDSMSKNSNVTGGCKRLNSSEKTLLESVNISIPDGYCLSAGLGIYKLHEDLATWNKARKICIKEGAHLAIVNSQQESEMLANMFKHSNLMKYEHRESVVVFLGFHDLYQEGEFVTIFDDSLDKVGYSTWSKGYGGQPDNGRVSGQGKGSQNCGALVTDGGLDDVGCSWDLGFICEIPIRQSASLA